MTGLLRVAGPGGMLRAMKVAALMLLAVTAHGCAPSASRGGFDSGNPAARLYAIEHAARTNDRTAIPRLVEELESDDPAVRFLAISTLHRLTGETHGYRDFDPPPVRAEAVERWRTAATPETANR
jgi:hypothetical protein